MAPPSKLQAKADSMGKTIEQMLIDAVKEHGSIYRAAIALDFAPNTVHDWKKKRGLDFVRTIEVRLVPAIKGKSGAA
jgi:hypothetical protein